MPSGKTDVFFSPFRFRTASMRKSKGSISVLGREKAARPSFLRAMSCSMVDRPSPRT